MATVPIFGGPALGYGETWQLTMIRLVYALAGAWLAALAAGSALAGSGSSRLSVTVTVVAPGTLGGTNRPPGPSGATSGAAGETTEGSATAMPPQDAPTTPLLDTASPTR
jgi:hypothetical protein